MIIDCNAIRFHPTARLWPKLRPIFQSEWCTEFWKEQIRDYADARGWPHERIELELSLPGAVPAHFDSCDWRLGRKGRPPQWHRYVVHGACHWMAPVYLRVIGELELDEGWTLLNGPLHSTVWNRQRGIIFDPQYEALGVSPREAFRLATASEAKRVVLSKPASVASGGSIPVDGALTSAL
jgi:hypothetical protein